MKMTLKPQDTPVRPKRPRRENPAGGHGVRNGYENPAQLGVDRWCDGAPQANVWPDARGRGCCTARHGTGGGAQRRGCGGVVVFHGAGDVARGILVDLFPVPGPHGPSRTAHLAPGQQPCVLLSWFVLVDHPSACPGVAGLHGWRLWGLCLDCVAGGKCAGAGGLCARRALRGRR